MKPLHLRILRALHDLGDRAVSYHALMYKVWPTDKYPRAYRHSVNGGPPGVAMTYGNALNELQQMGMISRMARILSGKPERFGQEDVWLTSDGRKAAREGR